MASRVHRSGGIVAFDTEPPAAYETTPGGLLLKSVRNGDGELPEPGQIVTVKYSTTLLSNGQTFDNIPEISFVLGMERKQDLGRKFAWGAPSRTLDALPLLQEAMVGMRVGDARRVSVTPSFRRSALSMNSKGRSLRATSCSLLTFTAWAM